MEGKKLVDISDTDLSNIYASLNELVVNVRTGTDHTPVVISDKTGRYLEALHMPE